MECRPPLFGPFFVNGSDGLRIEIDAFRLGGGVAVRAVVSMRRLKPQPGPWARCGQRWFLPIERIGDLRAAIEQIEDWARREGVLRR